MSTTARDIIKGALRLVGILAAGEEPAAEDEADSLDVLNEMMFGFQRDGVKITHTVITDPAAIFPIPDQDRKDIKYCLAKRLAQEFGRTLQPGILGDCNMAYQNLMATYMQLPRAVVDSALRRRPAHYDITRG